MNSRRFTGSAVLRDFSLGSDRVQIRSFRDVRLNWSKMGNEPLAREWFPPRATKRAIPY
jgi:hypothetical protein